MAEERRDYAILVSLAMREEAEVMASALRAEGIDAFVGNAHHANVDWGWTLALGGLQVMVPRAKLAEAKEVIRERIREAAEMPDPEAEPAKRRDHWKVWAVILVAHIIVAFGVMPTSALTMHDDAGRLARDAELRRAHYLGPDEWTRLPVYFSAPVTLTEAEQFAVLRDYCRDNPWDSVALPPIGGFAKVVPCADVFLVQPAGR